jgi:GMP synthase (glutamine-hydrolysing)
VELTPNKATGASYPLEERRAWRVCRETLAQGVWLRPLADVLYVMPPLAITLDTLREIHRIAKPTFASCWGFQAMARAMGGECLNDVPNAEVGTIELQLTDAGHADPVFSILPLQFAAHAGHEDHVVRLPPDAKLLASSPRVAEQAFRFAGRPIYCTQFHPELDRAAMLERVIAYPEYIARIARISFDEFIQNVRETPEANSLLRSFVKHFLT